MRAHSVLLLPLLGVVVACGSSAASSTGTSRPSDNTAASGPIASASGRTSTPPPTDAMSAYFNAAAPPDGMKCDDMSAPQCLQSTHCVLAPPKRGVAGQYVGGDYVCRDARGPCEGGVAQGNPKFSSDCGSRAHCVYRQAECFCLGETKTPSGVAGKPSCACGGGAPAMCVAEPTPPCKLACPGGIVDYSCGADARSTLVSAKCPDGKPSKIKIGYDGHTVTCDLSCTGAGGSCEDDTAARCTF